MKIRSKICTKTSHACVRSRHQRRWLLVCFCVTSAFRTSSWHIPLISRPMRCPCSHVKHYDEVLDEGWQPDEALAVPFAFGAIDGVASASTRKTYGSDRTKRPAQRRQLVWTRRQYARSRRSSSTVYCRPSIALAQRRNARRRRRSSTLDCRRNIAQIRRRTASTVCGTIPYTLLL